MRGNAKNRSILEGELNRKNHGIHRRSGTRELNCERAMENLNYLKNVSCKENLFF